MITEEEIEAQSERGSNFADAGDWLAAKKIWARVLARLEPPVREHSAYSWLMASIGDAQFHLGEFHDARVSFMEADATAEEFGNPFIALRTGQCSLQLGDEDSALEFLTKAYMSEGEEIFAEDDPSYLAFLRSRIAL